MDKNTILIIICAVAVILFVVIYNKLTRMPHKDYDKQSEVDSDDLKVLVEYAKVHKEEEEQKQKMKELKTAEMKDKLETFKRTKDELKAQLATQLGEKDWIPLNKILSKMDKGTVGIYVLYNETKDKYYVGQSKEIFARIKKHFEIEPIARDFCAGDVIKVKILTAAELNSEYRIDHIEKTGIEIFNSNTDGYNKTNGNL